MPATATRNQGKSKFVKEVLNDNPQANAAAVNEACRCHQYVCSIVARPCQQPAVPAGAVGESARWAAEEDQGDRYQTRSAAHADPDRGERKQVGSGPQAIERVDGPGSRDRPADDEGGRDWPAPAGRGRVEEGAAADLRRYGRGLLKESDATPPIENVQSSVVMPPCSTGGVRGAVGWDKGRHGQQGQPASRDPAGGPDGHPDGGDPRAVAGSARADAQRLRQARGPGHPGRRGGRRG